MKHVKQLSWGSILISAVLMAFGAFLVVFGEYDDSPGGTLIGFVMTMYGIWRLIRR